MYLLTQDFKVDNEECTSGIVRKGKYYVKLDCKIQLVALVEAGSSTGYVAEVTRSLDGKMR